MSLCQCQWKKRFNCVWSLHKAQLTCVCVGAPSLMLFISSRAQCQKFCSKSKIDERERRSVSDARKKDKQLLLVFACTRSPTHTCTLLAICTARCCRAADLFWACRPLWAAAAKERVAKEEEKKQKKQLANSDTKNWNKRSKRKSTPKTGIVQINLDINCVVAGRLCVCVCVCFLLRFVSSCLLLQPIRRLLVVTKAATEEAKQQNKEAQISAKQYYYLFSPINEITALPSLCLSLSPTVAWESRVCRRRNPQSSRELRQNLLQIPQSAN